MSGKYIYGVIETSESLKFGMGEDRCCESVYTIPYLDISAVVSDSAVLDYSAIPKYQLARCLLRHQQVNENIMDSYPVIPMKLGTFASYHGEVEDILSGGYFRFKEVFRKISDKAEMDIAATWADVGSVISRIGEMKEIKALRERLASNPRGVSVEDRIMAGNMVKQALDAQGESSAAEINGALGMLSAAYAVHDPMDDSMICNTAFLVEKVKKDLFESKLEELDGIFGGEVNFRCVGPLPPYSFCTAEVMKFKPDDLALAKKILDLDLGGRPLSADDIEKAYKKSAMRCHPDISGSDGEFTELNNAYRLLIGCLGDGQAGPNEHPRNDGRGDILSVKING
jgi:Gas vesicle synthesis protein GvpL/GvpF/DnaJ domain